MIAVLGAGESGVGAALLAKKKGYDVFVSDSGSVKDHFQNELVSAGLEWEQGEHNEEKILSANLLIKSPGIPETKLVAKARAKGIEVLSEIEFASRFSEGRIIAITGTNGKTTTASLTYYILKAQGLMWHLQVILGRVLQED